MPDAPDLSVDLAGLRLASPLIAAAGTCGYAHEFDGVLPARAIGAIVTKSITREPRAGNRPWRILDSGAGMLNAIGLANVGVEAFLGEKLGSGRPGAQHTPPVPLIGSVAGDSIDAYVRVAGAFAAEPRLAAIELNVSCPNTADGRQFGDDPAALGDLVAAVRAAIAGTPLLVKLSPLAPDPVRIAAAAVERGASALTIMNTVPALAIDVETRRPRLSNGMGGLSGPAIHPMAVRLVRLIYEAVARPASVPIVGLGGVMHWRDAAEFVLAGASAIGLGTALFVDPRCPARIHRGLAAWVRRQGAARLADLTGGMEA